MSRLVIRQAAIIRGQGLRLVRLSQEIAMLETLTRGRLMQVTRPVVRDNMRCMCSFQDLDVEEIATLYS